MDKIQIAKDDLLDIVEMSDKLVKAIYSILDTQDMNIALSALTKAVAELLVDQASSKNEIIDINRLFKQLIDISMMHAFIEKEEKENTPE